MGILFLINRDSLIKHFSVKFYYNKGSEHLIPAVSPPPAISSPDYAFLLDLCHFKKIISANSGISRKIMKTGSEKNDMPDISAQKRSDPILNEASARLRELYGSSLEGLYIERLVVGVLFVGVKFSNGRAGVAYTPPEVIIDAGNRILRSTTPAIRGMSAADVLDDRIPGPYAGVIRLAALNALSVPFFEDGTYRLESRSGDLSGIKPLFRHRRICIVGAIIPLLKNLKELGTAGVTIIDYKKETQEEALEGYGVFISPEHTTEALSRCDTAIFTGASIANGTAQGLLDAVPPHAAIAMVGPTAGFVPDPLFARRVALTGTVMITESDMALEILAEGGGALKLFGECAQKINILNTARLAELGLEGGI
jgi:uncharacterized protein (DUF4213/DUF364 family)